MVHIVAYDLKSPNDTAGDYERVIDGIKSSYPTWCHLEKSVWIIASDEDSQVIRDTIRKFLFDTDVLFVARLQGNWGSFNLGQNRSEWLKGRVF